MYKYRTFEVSIQHRLKEKHLIKYISPSFINKTKYRIKCCDDINIDKKKIQKIYKIDDVMNIHNYVDVGFGPRVFTNTVDENAYFDPRITKRRLSTHKHGKANTQYNMGYYRQS